MPSTVIQTEYRLKTVLPLEQVPDLRSWLQNNFGHSSTAWKIETHSGSFFNWRGIAGAVKSKNPETKLPVTVIVTVYEFKHLMTFAKSWETELLLEE
jgi:hypothetical protein